MDKSEFIRNLLEISDQDLESAIILFEKGKFPQAVFFLQQSVEKCTKAFALFGDALTVEDLKNRVVHLTPKIYTKLADKELRKTVKIKEVFDKDPVLRKTGFFKDVDINTYRNGQKTLISELEKELKRKEFVTDKEDDIVLAINGIKQLLSESNIENLAKIKIPKEEFEKSLKEGINPIIKLMKDKGIKASEEWEKEMQSFNFQDFEKILNDYLKEILIINKINTMNFFLTLITFKHAVVSRYPEEFNPIEKYNSKYPLIKYFKEVCSFQQDNVKLSKDKLLSKQYMEKLIKQEGDIK